MKQAYQIIPIDDYAVGVSDAQPKDGDIRVHITTGNYSTHHSTDNNLHKGWKKLVFTIDKDMRAEGIPMLIVKRDALEWWDFISERTQYRLRKEFNIEADCRKPLTENAIIAVWIAKGFPELSTQIEFVEKLAQLHCRQDGWSLDTLPGKSVQKAYMVGYLTKATEQQDKKWSDADMVDISLATTTTQHPLYKSYKEWYRRNWDKWTAQSLMEWYRASTQKKKYPETIELETVLTGQCNCACHKPGFDLMHMMPCCHPTQSLIINDDLTISI